MLNKNLMANPETSMANPIKLCRPLIGDVAEWIRRLCRDQKVPGSNPADSILLDRFVRFSVTFHPF